MASYLRPRRGKKATAIAQLTSSNPLKRGEIFFEVPDEGVGTGKGKIKMGDGVTAYADLPYFSEGGSGGGVGEDIYISLPSTNWTTETISGTTYYVQNGAAAGATSTTVPVIIPIYTTDAEMEAYSNIIRVESANNVLKFIAVDRPSVTLTVVAKFAIESTADLDVISDALGVEITQAEYDALTPEEKANGTYWITDGSLSGVVIDTALDATSNNAIANKPVATAINQINNDLTDTETTSLIGSGTKTFSISSTRKRLTIITKKSNVIVGTKEIPTSIFESGDVVPLGNESPVIGTDNIRTGGNLDTALKGQELYIHGIQDSLGANNDQIRGVTSGTITNGKDIGLAASAEFSDGATLTFNGNNSFTLSVTDSTLSVYVY